MAVLCYGEGSCLHIIYKGLKTAYTGFGGYVKNRVVYPSCWERMAFYLLGCSLYGQSVALWSYGFMSSVLAGCNRSLWFHCKPLRNGRGLFLG